MEIAGCAAVVTGGGGGLGAATASALAAAGAKVTVLDLNAATVEAAAARFGGLGLACDVADAAAGEAAIARAEAAHGPARILVNCAGIAPPKRLVGRDGPIPLAEFEAVVRVNLIGTVNMMRLVAARMVGLAPLAGGDRGAIVNTASVAAYEGQIGQAAYAASKGAVVSLTLPAARDLAQYAIRVNTIAPGLFGTPMLRGLPEAVQESLAKSVPYPQRLGEPEEYAALALHLIQNGMMNGETVRIDGAIRMAPR